MQKPCCGAGVDNDFSLTKACGDPDAPVCPNPDERISWDGLHLTQQAYHGHGQNFAVACSTALPTEVLAKKNILNPDTRRSLNVQLDWMSTYFNGICHNIDDCAEKLKTALFMVGEIGGNDITMHFFKGHWFWCYPSVVPGNFPIGCLPISLTLFKTNNSDACVEFHCLKEMNNFSIYHNDQLRRALEDLRKELPNVVIVYGDYYNAFQWVNRFDAASLQKSCCGVGDDYDFSLIKMCGAPGATVCPNPDERISWDRVHLTQKAYQYMANWLINDILPNLHCK
ncbi:gdsl esterase/lipase [Quercus suber]|uniref:Gdsl esterase/lipase n=1 Tax=Quercus suber TaxID=58331 RepID=A0AAW0LQ94_QUESU